MEAIGALLLSSVIAYLMWRTLRFSQTYMKWCSLFKSDSVTIIGELHPLWGHLHLFPNVSIVFKVLEENVKSTKAKLIGLWMSNFFPMFIACHPDTIKILMKSSEPKPTYVGSGYRGLLPWIGEGLLISKGKKWERNRRLLTPAFHFQILRPYVKVYNEVADILLAKFEKASANGNIVEVYEPVGLATFDTMLRCAFTYKGNVQQQGKDHPYVSAVKTLGKLSTERSLKPWQFYDIMYLLTPSGQLFRKTAKFIHDFDENLIEIRQKSLVNDNALMKKRHLDFLDILLTAKDENGEGLTNREIRDEVDTFLFEGHDTTASALTWAIYALAKYQKEQEIVFQEIKSVMEDKEDIEWDDLSKLHRLSLFIKESMRYYTPVPAVSRITTKETEINGAVIPPNVEVWLAIHTCHKRADVWKDPHDFNPRRFLDSQVKLRDPYDHIPFSAGPRNCIGQHFALDEIKVILAKLIKRFHVKYDPKNEAVPYAEVVMRSEKNGVNVFFKLRQ